MAKLKARAIFTNDGECDDMNSFVHLLLYANDIDIEGIVSSSSCFHFAGDPEKGVEPKRWADPVWMWEDVDAYAEVYPNLVKHDPDYPTPDALREVLAVGNVKTMNDMDEPSMGSELIREAIFKDDPRPVWLLAGGGTNTIGRALMSIEEEFKGTERWREIYEQVCSKAIIYMIVTQDDTYKDYIAGAWPDLPMLHCTNIMGIAFMFNERLDPPEALHVFRGPWLHEQLLTKGPLLAKYHTWADGHVYPGEEPRSQFGSNPELLGGNWWGKEDRERYDMISEGDSPSFLHLIDVGLRSTEDPSWGGWGGRFMRKPDNEFNPEADYWMNAEDGGHPTVKPGAYQFSRWVGDWMNEFAGRAEWCVTSDFGKANHRPVLEIEEGLDLTAAPGETLTLTAKAEDPDGDELAITWFDYPEAGTYGKSIDLAAQGPSAELTIPADAPAGSTIHVICRASDEPAHEDGFMCAYARIVVTVA